MIGRMAPTGNLKAKVVHAPKAPTLWRIRNTGRLYFLKGLLGYHVAHLLTRTFGIPAMVARLDAKLLKRNGDVIDYGTLGYRVVTTAFVNYVVDQLQTETSTFGDFKFHDSGVGTTAENVTDTAIETTDAESRATGTQTEGAANIYQSVGTIAYTTTKAITEHGLFNDASTGTLMDRTVFSAINVVNGDSIQFTYSLTLTAGS